MSRLSRHTLLLAALLGAAVAGCAIHREPVGVPIEQRPRPPQPPPEPPKSAPGDTTRPAPPPPRTLTPSAEESMRALVVRDTSAVSSALKRCAGQTLLPEQENTYDATSQLLAQSREALARGDVARARSIIRNAKQLVTSLECH